jgi:autotransporter adhesin
MNQIYSIWHGATHTSLTASGPARFGGNRAAARKKAIAQAVLTATAFAGGIPAVAAGVGSIESGVGADASGNYSIAIGQPATAQGDSSIAVGTQAATQGDGAIAVGLNANAQAAGASALGENARAIGGGAVAAGLNANALGDGTTAVGMNANVQGERATALGMTATALGIDSIAAGGGTIAADAAASAFGALATAAGTGSAAVGYHAQTSGNAAFAGGMSARAAADYGVALGNEAAVDGTGGIALGAFAQTTGVNASALGYGAVATDSGAVALGHNANASAANSVALGADSATTADLNQRAFVPSGLDPTLIAAPDPTGEVSLGSASRERRLTNLAAGAEPTDAVNVSQLRAVDGKVDAIARSSTQRYFKANADTADADADASGVHALAAGVGASAAGADATAVGAGARASGPGSAVLGAGAVAGAANATAIGLSATADGLNATAIGAYSAVNGDGSIALGYSASASADNAVALGRNSLADRANTVSVGSSGNERQIANVAAGTADTDAVNVAQLKTVSDQGVATAAKLDGAVMYDQNPDGTINRDSITLGSGGAVIHNVAAGSADTDAVNVAQLKTVSDQGVATAAKLDGAVMYDRNPDGSINRNSITLGGGAADGGAVLHNIAAGTADTDAVNVAQLNTVSGQSAATAAKLDGAVMYDQNPDGSINHNSITLGGGAAKGGAVIHNVAAGTADTDAVNVAQLKTVSDQGVATAAKLDGAVMYDQNSAGSINRSSITLGSGAASGGAIIHNVADGVDASDAVNLGQLNAAVNGAVGNALINAASPFISVAGDRDTEGAVSSGAHAVAAGANARATGVNAVAAGANATAGGNNATALGAAANASADSSVALGHGSVADRANTVSVGVTGQERQITNVAAGTQPTDAVNFGQLQQSMDGAVSQANRYTDDQIRTVRRDGYGGTASALAMAGLPQAILPGRGMIAMAGGTYGGQSALAIGVSQLSDTGKWAYKLQGTTDSRGQFGASIGAGVHW